MKITVQITTDVPDGAYCNGCKHIAISQLSCKCKLFDVELDGGWNIDKCDKCKEAKGDKP